MLHSLRDSIMLPRRPSRVVFLSGVLFAIVVCFANPVRGEKLRDLVDINGARDNQLLGYGVVTGLSGTGDDISAPLAVQSTLSMLRRLGVQVEARQLRLRNIAAVVVTATIPPFSRTGSRLDVTVASIGNAKSLAGGVLVQTVLKGANRKSYAVAQGGIVIGGYIEKGRSGSKIKTGSTTVGRVPAGALVEREIATKFVFDGKLYLTLRRPSFSLASDMAKLIEENLGEGSAFPQDGGTVAVTIPKEFVKRPVDLVAQLHKLELTPSRRARVVISERTQTIVAGGDVRLAAVAVVHGNLTIVIKETPVVSQPGLLAQGQTVQTQESQVEVQEERSAVQYINGAATLSDLASALGTLGLTARELISVLQAMKEAGALEAELVVQ